MPALLACSNLLAPFCFTHGQAYTAAMPRKLVWIQSQKFQGFSCSECNWGFKSSGALLEEPPDEMKQKYEGQRDKEVAAHVCVKHPRAVSPQPE